MGDQSTMSKDSEANTVSLDDYRTEGVIVLGGEERGKTVAQHIIDNYGMEVVVEVPDDIACISTHFKAGFNSVLPGKLNTDTNG